MDNITPADNTQNENKSLTENPVENVVQDSQETPDSDKGNKPEEGRTKKAFRNMLTGIISKLLIFGFAFAVRTLFVRILGAEYNGINGLFSNILSVVCLADLGIESVLDFALYKELKDQNREKIIQIIASFKKVYLGFAVFVLIVGLLIMAFLQFIVNTEINLGEVYGYYLLYLANSIASYLYIYKTTIINADQRIFISNITFTVSKIVMYLLQVLVLVLWKNLWVYLIIQIICTFGYNFTLNLITVKKYPYLKNIKYVKNAKLDKELKNNIKSTLIYRASTVLIDNTDNIIISAIIGTFFAGLYSNYYMLTQYIAGIIYIAGNGLLASIGNLNTEMDSEKSFKYFKVINFIYSVVGIIYLTCFVNCMQQFVPIWVGEEFLLSDIFSLTICIQFFIGIIMRPVAMFRETLGLFKEVIVSMIIAAVLNIVLSIVLGIYIGITGIVLATIVSKLFTQFCYEPIVLFKKFGKKAIKYFVIELKYLIQSLIIFFTCAFVCHFYGSSIGYVILRVVTCLAICLILEILFNIKSLELNVVFLKIKFLLGRKKRVKQNYD